MRGVGLTVPNSAPLTFIINHKEIIVQSTPEVEKLVNDLAFYLKEQFNYIPKANAVNREGYLAAIKDAAVGTCIALHLNIKGFDADAFYTKCGYPGTRPKHS